LISPNYDVEFHVHVNAFLLDVGAMLIHNIIGKHDQPIIYASKLINSVERNYNTTKHETLTMVFKLHKFLGNVFLKCKPYGFGLSNKQTISLKMYC
jgi:hypothetical protein